MGNAHEKGKDPGRIVYAAIVVSLGGGTIVGGFVLSPFLEDSIRGAFIGAFGGGGIVGAIIGAFGGISSRVGIRGAIDGAFFGGIIGVMAVVGFALVLPFLGVGMIVWAIVAIIRTFFRGHRRRR